MGGTNASMLPFLLQQMQQAQSAQGGGQGTPNIPTAPQNIVSTPEYQQIQQAGMGIPPMRYAHVDPTTGTAVPTEQPPTSGVGKVKELLGNFLYGFANTLGKTGVPVTQEGQMMMLQKQMQQAQEARAQEIQQTGFGLGMRGMMGGQAALARVGIEAQMAPARAAMLQAQAQKAGFIWNPAEPGYYMDTKTGQVSKTGAAGLPMLDGNFASAIGHPEWEGLEVNPNLFRLAKDSYFAAVNAQTARERADAIKQLAGIRGQFADLARIRTGVQEMPSLLTPQEQQAAGLPLGPGGQPVGVSVAARTGVIPTAPTRTMAEMARGLIPKVDDLKTLLTNARSELGWTSGGLNQLMMKLGPDDPRFTQLNSFMSFMTSAAVRTHFQARGGIQMYDKFIANLWNPRATPEATIGALDGLKPFLETYKATGTVPTTMGLAGQGPGLGAPAVPKGRISVVSPDGKAGTIPVDQWPSAQKAGYKKAK